MKKIQFPRDEQAHNNIIEWWYFNGHLQGSDGNHYAYMNCLFQADAKKVNLPFIKVPFKKTFFSHSILSDIKKQKNYPKTDYISLVSRDSFKKPLLFVDYINTNILEGYSISSIEELAPFIYRVRGENFDLVLSAEKKPFLEGGDGYLDLGGRSTYYYSITNLKTEGTIKINGKEIQVKGKSWLDHQWADAPYAKDKWNWFSIQLDNNTEIVCFEYEGKSKTTTYAGISYHDNRVEHYYDVKFTPIGKAWKSLRSKASYPLCWQIEIPKINLKLEVEPMIKKQEMLFGTINYWEGPLSVSGAIGKKKVKGKGFLELVGRQSKYGAVKFVEETLSRAIKDLKKINWK